MDAVRIAGSFVLSLNLVAFIDHIATYKAALRASPHRRQQ